MPIFNRFRTIHIPSGGGTWVHNPNWTQDGNEPQMNWEGDTRHCYCYKSRWKNNWPVEVIHISDLHIKQSTDYRIGRIVDGLLERKRVNSKVLFLLTGDVVANISKDRFNAAYNVLQDIRDNLVVIPGNHDNTSPITINPHLGGFLKKMQLPEYPFILYLDRIRVIGIYSGGEKEGIIHNLNWINEKTLTGNCLATIVMMHHPIEDIQKLRQHYAADAIKQANKPIVLLCGHNHNSGEYIIGNSDKGIWVSKVITGVTGTAHRIMITENSSIEITSLALT